MTLVAVKHSTAMAVDALTITHDTDIAEPIALYVRADEQFPHVVLLLPGSRLLRCHPRTWASRLTTHADPDSQGAAGEDREEDRIARPARDITPHELGNRRYVTFGLVTFKLELR